MSWGFAVEATKGTLSYDLGVALEAHDFDSYAAGDNAAMQHQARLAVSAAYELSRGLRPDDAKVRVALSGHSHSVDAEGKKKDASDMIAVSLQVIE